MDEKGLPYGYSWYMDALCGTWAALVLNDYDAVWPVAIGRKYGFIYAYRPLGIQQLGISSLHPISQEQTEEFVEALMKHFRFADLWLNEGQMPSVESAVSQLFPCTNMLIDISRPYQEIYNEFDNDIKRRLKRLGENHTMTIFEHDSPKVLLNLFRETKAKQIDVGEDFFINMEKAMYQWLHHGMGKLWTAYGDGNQILGGIFIVETEKRSILFSSAINQAGRKAQANIYLLNEYLIYAAEKKQYFDFEGTEDKGLARFNKSWGIKIHPYYRFWYNNLPWPLNKLRKP